MQPNPSIPPLTALYLPSPPTNLPLPRHDARRSERSGRLPRSGLKGGGEGELRNHATQTQTPPTPGRRRRPCTLGLA